MTAAAKPPSGNRRGVVQRFTGKVGPLPVWAWALLILTVGYLAYRLSGAGSSTSGTASSSSSDTAASTADNTGQPGGAAAAADNADVLAGISGLAGSVDSLTSLVQSSPAFYGDGSGDSGSGSTVTNDAPTTAQEPPQARPLPPTPARPTPHPAASAKHRFYTYRPGTKGHPNDTAPPRGPAGTKLHFARGKGYYYA